MGFLTTIRAEVDRSATSDFWYTPLSRSSASGVVITPDTSLNISTVFACVQAISTDMAGLPLIIYRRLNPGKERATNHPLFDPLHGTPNSWQTSFEWRELLWNWVLLWGNAYCRIVEGPRGFADQLIPLHPSRVKVDQLFDDRLRYTYSPGNGQADIIYSQDEIFHFRGPSRDGIVGVSIVTYARESFGLGMATEQFGARLFSQGAVPSSVLKHPGELGEEAQKRLIKTFDAATTGLSNAHRTLVLEEGMEWQQISMSSEDSQFLETRSFQVEEMARWFNVPLTRIGHTEKSTSWGTGIEQFELGYVKHTLLPWAVRFEQAVTRDLILAPQTFFVEFLFDGLLRGDMKTRFESYRTGVLSGWLDRNEVRAFENMNPREGASDLLIPQNMAIMDEDGTITPVNAADEPMPPAIESGQPSEPTALHYAGMAQRFAHEAAARVVRKEVERVKAIAKRDQDEDHYSNELIEFYYMHAQHVAETLHISADDADFYTISQRDAVLKYGCQPIERAQGAAHIAQYSDQRVTELAALALGEE